MPLMQVFNQFDDRNATVTDSLTLPFELRQRSRQRAQLDSGEEVALYLPRGTRLCHGDRLVSDDGLVVEIRAAQEQVSTLCCDDALQLARACYHLGNRHVALQIGAGWARYLHDHVLDDMLHGLGLDVEVKRLPFEPEPGAYHSSHHHTHD